ncbi:calmodulin-binding transcription activator 1 isoform X1 [Canna indica]|uniref:Calmodulin-binding transcription activator 1 isoform X1 n=1 Tax=Canna indica TaxID=4628 RepID=A0AAQ3JTK1_9LILI|nr:calmodulin-binding transcription activator 1 isoform X1 [Canna indica]
MAESRQYAINPQLDIAQIIQEAKSRWLRPSEICEILRNYQRFLLTPDPPSKPPGGSLFLFDRKALRYFRKDGHNWRKKKDGKTVREAHEKLKCGSIDVLHCYYAHGEDNENFQRRSYWMLDGQLEHIVLVHYRDVNEGSRPTIPHLLNTDARTVSNPAGSQTSSAVCSPYLNPLTYSTQASYASSAHAIDWNPQTTSSEFEDADSGEEHSEASFADSLSYAGVHVRSSGKHTGKENNAEYSGSLSHLHSRGFIDTGNLNRLFGLSYANQVPLKNLILGEDQQKNYGASAISGSSSGACFDHHTSTSRISEFLAISQKETDMLEGTNSFEQAKCSVGVSKKVSQCNDVIKFVRDGGSNISTNDHQESFMEGTKENQVRSAENMNLVDHKQTMNTSDHIYDAPHDHVPHNTHLRNNGISRLATASDQPMGNECQASNGLNKPLDNDGDLKRLDSFGRWMSKEIGKDCDDSLMASDSCNYWNAIDSQSDDKEVSSLPSHMQLHMVPLEPLLSHEQLFTIHDFSPEWAFCGAETKILITGSFLGGIEPASIKWCCMFGELEVPAEVLTANVIRCQAPIHSAGRVPFYITCSNRVACSEIREFEYREYLPRSYLVPERALEEEINLQVRLAKLLSTGIDRKWLVCSVENCDKCILKQKLSSMLGDEEKAFQGYLRIPRDRLMQKLLKEKLYEWLVCKTHEEGKGPNILDEEGYGAIHLAAALGYEWAMSPIVSSGVSPSFRDALGRTGLHWAAYFGRERTVVELVRLGAAAGAVEHPTSKVPIGKTAADLASSRGHKGIAGYLAEADLTSHLSSLTVKEGEKGTPVNLAAEKVIETVQEHNINSSDGERGEQISLRGSLAAVRNSAQAAARIHAAFRVQSFLQTNSKDKHAEISDDMMIVSSLNMFPKMSHYNESLHMSAVKIQQKYRGWKGRKDFLKIRDRIVKIQAHVRGHQVRKQYKKVIWSVSIVEKAILRWRRKGAGLRGFKANKTTTNFEQKVETTDEYDFLHLSRRQKFAGVEKALARVQSMARDPAGRDQYMRLVACSLKFKRTEASSSAQVQNNEEQNDGR